MRRTFPTEPVEPTEPAPPLSQKVKGRHTPQAKETLIKSLFDLISVSLTLTIPFSAFLTCQAMPPQMTDRGEIGRQRRGERLAGQIGEIIRKHRKGERGRMKELAADVERL